MVRRSAFCCFGLRTKVLYRGIIVPLQAVGNRRNHSRAEKRLRMDGYYVSGEERPGSWPMTIFRVSARRQYPLPPVARQSMPLVQPAWRSHMA